MRQGPVDLEILRRALEHSVERAETLARQLAASDAPRHLILEAQDDWSDAVANLAAYLLATGESGWVGVSRLPIYGSMPASELRPL